jgi:AcrR family transcriptional regulator
LHHAEQLFLAQGIKAVNISDIAAAAQMTRATIYRYFDHRLAIVWALYQRYDARKASMMPDEIYDQQLEPQVRLRMWFEVTKAFFFTHHALVKFRIEMDELYANESEFCILKMEKKLNFSDDKLLIHILQCASNSVSNDNNDLLNLQYDTVVSLVHGFEQKIILDTAILTNSYCNDLRKVYDAFCAILLHGIRKNQE